MQGTKSFLDDLKIRTGYGTTGNSNIGAYNYAFQYATGDSYLFAITGTDTEVSSGYCLSNLGDENAKWETIRMFNVGFDATLLNNRLTTTFDYYIKKITDMLVSANWSALAGNARKPNINIGDMENRGIDFSIGWQDQVSDFRYSINANLSHYRNEVVKLGSSDLYNYTNLSMVNRTTEGQPIGMFYGYKVNGFYENVNEVLALPPLGQSVSNEDAAKAWVGKFKFADTNGDGRLTEADRTFIGSPHPDLIAGLNATVTWKNWDLTMFWYSTIGNDLFNNTKYFTDFWLFEGNKSSRMRDLSWKPGADNSKAILPILDYGDTYSGTNSNSYYVENASFLRLKNLVLGYTLPKDLLSKAGIQNLRLYVQAENLLTITGYSGLDPEYTNVDPAATNGGDLRRGIDMGGWPTTMRFLFGVNFAF